MQESYHAHQSPATKICNACQQEKPLDAFHKMSSVISDGHRQPCKVCRKEHDKQPKVIVQRPLFVFSKVCTKCTEEKPIELFNRMQDSKDGYHTQCRQCQSEYNRRLRQANLEQIQAYDRSRIGNPARLARHRERYRERYASDPRHIEGQKQAGKRWFAANKLRKYEQTMQYVARKKKAQTSPVSLKRVLERDGMWCYICEQDILPGQKIDFDHVIPISRGGPHCEDNLKVTHHVCNRRKWDKLPSELTPFERRGIT